MYTYIKYSHKATSINLLGSYNTEGCWLSKKKNWIINVHIHSKFALFKYLNKI